ncbi:plant intracellular Ras-group-related LRR protein 5-like [Punica granatum]|uniref:Plant intracellular Ras-group-related LRR protein 5-like n=1 Tax=Punica granatum TaxID=22663 RepID=A0A6P8D5J0_PUNGR|nr:plant intracellular Ras-group-related LRR protein 5-like [Punica granatum]XP_031388812.1 plant intracellular Ras-group-related LRR protein 5-like [Punica granatum]XP_031388813.1 plant intracellular Ras-group-related LRR protein 5-like [Punica granatum]
MLCAHSYDYLKDEGDGYIFKQKELSSLRNLRYLECFGANISGHLKHLLPKLMWLSWRHCPRKFMGTDLYLRILVIPDLSWSSVSETWGGWSQIRTRNSLKVLDLRCCDGLIKTPDFSKYSSLERLILEECTNLVEIDPSIDINTVKLRQRIGRPMKLVFLNFGSCEGLEKLLDSLGNRRSLAELDLSETRITELPDTIRNVKKLARLDLSCIGFIEQPHTIGNLKTLVGLDLSCTGITELPYIIGNLKKLARLYLSCIGITELLDTIGNLKKLAELDLSEA